VGREKKIKNKHNNMMGSKRDVNMARKKTNLGSAFLINSFPVQ
jgi:hypothetical protein